MNVNNIKAINEKPVFSGFDNQARNYHLTGKQDSFELSEKQDKSCNGQFDVSECAKNFVKGVLSPLTAIVEHPVITIGTIALTAAACTLIPVLTPVMAAGFGALSVYQAGKGVYNAARNYKKGEYDKAEQSFNQIGQGTAGIALTAAGLKSSAKIAKEAKLMNELGVNTLTKAQKQAAALEIKNGSRIDAVKEITSLFTSKAGLKSLINQFKPVNIAARGKDAFKFLFTKEQATKIKREKMKFSETAEGKRRSALSSEEIEAEVQQLAKEAFDEYGVPEDLRPEVKVIKQDAKTGGCYKAVQHTIEINENSYREGFFDLPETIKHEATHANEAILRQRLPMQEKEKLAVEYLLDKIQNGDKEKVVVDGGFGTSVTMKPPKMNAKMKTDFAKLAQDKLYKTTKYSDEELMQMVKPLVDSNPEFIQGYGSADDAASVLSRYAKSHNTRYKMALQNSTGFDTSKVDTSLLKNLTAEEKAAAIKSFRESIDCMESNAANQTVLGIGGDFNQYQFTPEEVLAEQKGNSFEISKLERQLSDLRSRENYDLAEEARLLDQIKKSKLIIEYKTKGREMYGLYTESLNNPDNKKLAAKVAKMQAKLNKIQSQIYSIEVPVGDDILGMSAHMETNNYCTYQAKVRPETGATVGIPYQTADAAAIIAYNTEKTE